MLLLALSACPSAAPPAPPPAPLDPVELQRQVLDALLDPALSPAAGFVVAGGCPTPIRVDGAVGQVATGDAAPVPVPPELLERLGRMVASPMLATAVAESAAAPAEGCALTVTTSAGDQRLAVGSGSPPQVVAVAERLVAELEAVATLAAAGPSALPTAMYSCTDLGTQAGWRLLVDAEKGACTFRAYDEKNFPVSPSDLARISRALGHPGWAALRAEPEPSGGTPTLCMVTQMPAGGIEAVKWHQGATFSADGQRYLDLLLSELSLACR